MFWLTKAALTHLNAGDAIIVTTSEQAYDPSKDIVDYALTKAAGMNFVKSMAKQLGPKGTPAPPHGYRVVRFRTIFANKTAVETVSLDYERTGWKVVGVTVR